MAAAKKPRLTELLGWLNGSYPAALAEEWDNVGLQVGNPLAEIEKILVCLDVEEITLRKAAELGAKLIVSHHPFIFRPLKKITASDTTGRLVMQAIKNDIAVVSAHTNLDRAKDGLNDWLAARLGLTQVAPLERPESGHFLKLVVFVPVGHEGEIMQALFAAGAGQIGDYDSCSFRTRGTGSFRGDHESTPFIGEAGELEETEELRVEAIVPRPLVAKVVTRMIKVHPYEEVAYDLIPLANERSDIGLGRIGRLAESVSLRDFAEQVKQALGIDILRLTGDLDRSVQKIAVCGGSGVSMYSEALRQGADCLVTGDVKFHEAQRARQDGMALIDAGHFATERLMVEELAERLRRFVADRQLAAEIIEMADEQDPFSFV